MKTSQVTCILPVKDMERARRFYESQLGLEAVGQKPDGKFVYATSARRSATSSRGA